MDSYLHSDQGSKTSLVQTIHLSPPVQMTAIKHRGKNFVVAREDLLPGGTKQRAIAQLVHFMTAKGCDHFLYASPFCGFAQVALSYVCKILNINCTIFAEVDPGTGKLHDYTRIAENYGAQVIPATSLQEAEDKAIRIAALNKNYYKAPLGFDCPEFKSFLKFELMLQWHSILKTLDYKPRALWLPVGSGTLAQVFSQFIDSETRIHCVNVHVLPADDVRIQAIREKQSITLFSSPQPFAEAAMELPIIPSNVFYDAKLWRFIAQHGEDGDLWWNVGR